MLSSNLLAFDIETDIIDCLEPYLVAEAQEASANLIPLTKVSDRNNRI